MARKGRRRVKTVKRWVRGRRICSGLKC